MRLADRALVRRLRRAVKRRIRTLKISNARRLVFWKRSFSLEKPWLYIPVLLLFLTGVAFNNPNGQAATLSALAVYCTATSLGRSRQLLTLLTASPERMILFFYPISDENFFHWAFRRFWLKSLVIWCLAAIGYAGASPLSGGWYIEVAVCATLQWLITFCAILALTAYVPRVSPWLTFALYLPLAVFYAPPAYAQAILPLLGFLPAGWTIDLFLYNAQSASAWATFAVAIPLFAALAFWLYRRLLRQTLSRQDLTRAAESAARLLSEPEESPEAEGDSLARPGAGPAVDPRLTPEWQRQRFQHLETQFAEFVRSGTWSAPLDWDAAPWLERLAGRWLNPEQRNLAEFLLAGELPHWSSRWRTSVIAAGVAVGVLALPRSPTSTWAAILAIGVSLVAGVPVTGGDWPATGAVRLSGKLAPLLACYPASYRLASITMTKINLVRTAVWAPLGVLFGAVFAWNQTADPLLGAWLALRIILLWVTVTPLFAASHFSKRTNDTKNLRVLRLLLILLAGFTVLPLVIAAAILCLAAPTPFDLLGLLATALISFAVWKLYGYVYNRAAIDLITSNEPQSQGRKHAAPSRQCPTPEGALSPLSWALGFAHLLIYGQLDNSPVP